MNDPEVTMLDAIDSFDRVRAMTWRLLNPKTLTVAACKTCRGRWSPSAVH